MNSITKREKEKIERRNKRISEILEAAEKLFSGKGIKDTKMIDIARECELSKGSLYFYFKSKDEIIWDLLFKHSEQEFNAGLQYIRTIEGDSYTKLKGYFELFTGELLEGYTSNTPSFEYREHMMGMLRNNELSDSMKEQFKLIAQRNLSFIVDLIKEGVADGTMAPTMDIEKLGKSIGTSFGLYFRYLISIKASFADDFLKDKKEEFKVYTQMVLSVLKP